MAVETTDEPFTREYSVESFGTDYLFRVRIRLGFKVSQSIPAYLHQIMHDLEKTGELPAHLTFSLASLMSLYRGGKLTGDGRLECQRDGQPYYLQDDAAVLNFFADTSSESPEEQAKEFLSNEAFFGAELCKVPGLVESVGASLREILDKGMRTVMNEKFGV